MLGDRIIEINEFILYYDGCFKVEFMYDNKKYCRIIYLDLKNLIKIFENEGLNISNKINAINFHFTGLRFLKSTLLFEVFDEADNTISFLTSEVAEDYSFNNIIMVDCEVKQD